MLRRGIASRYCAAIGILAALVGISVLLGWALGLPALTTLSAKWPPMAPVTAAAAALCGISVALTVIPKSAGPSARLVYGRIAISCAVIAALLGLLRLLGDLFAWGLPLDNLGLPALAARHGMRPGVMSPGTAGGFVLLGATLTLARTERRGIAYESLGLLALLIGWLGLTRYAFGGVALLPYTQMAMHTALALFLLATAALLLRTDVGISALLASRTSGGAAARRLLPAAVLVPLATGALALYAVRSGAIQMEQAFSLFALASVIAFAGLVWRSAMTLERTETGRRQVVLALEASEERTRLIIETALDAVVTMDRAGIITGWSARAEEIFGWGAAQAVGRSVAETIIPPSRALKNGRTKRL